MISKGRLSNLSLSAWSTEGENAFTGDTIVEADNLTGDGVEATVENLKLLTLLTGLSFDFSLNDSASLSSSVSHLPLLGLLPGLPMVMG